MQAPMSLLGDAVNFAGREAFSFQGCFIYQSCALIDCTKLEGKIFLTSRLFESALRCAMRSVLANGKFFVEELEQLGAKTLSHFVKEDLSKFANETLQQEEDAAAEEPGAAIATAANLSE